jgi:hypothetical protein
MEPIEVDYAERLIDVITRSRAAMASIRAPIIDADVAKYIATTWPQLLIGSIFALEKWQREPLLKVLHHAIRHAQDDLDLDEDDALALDVMAIAAGFLQTGVQARGANLRRGDRATAQRLRQAYEALVGRTRDARDMREMVGILKENRDPAFVLRRLRRLNPAFARLSAVRASELLASYTPAKPKRGSGLRTLEKIVACMVVEVGVCGVKRRLPGETDRDLADRTEDVRRRITSAMKRG